MGAVTILPGDQWRSSSLTQPQLEAVVSGRTTLRHVAQGVLDRRLATIGRREWMPELGAWGWRLSLTPFAVQIRRIEKARRRLAR
jgi:hypothetical protein